MSREYPDLIDPGKAADGKRVFQGTMPLERMSRLSPLLAAVKKREKREACAEFSADFRYDEQGIVTVDLNVAAQLPLICQRSLEPYLEKVERRSLIAVISDMAEQELIPESYEPVLIENGRLALLDLVEDELLLALPQVPRNPETAEVKLSTGGTVETPPGMEEEPTRRPFEGLAGLMKEIEEDSDSGSSEEEF